MLKKVLKKKNVSTLQFNSNWDLKELIQSIGRQILGKNA